jgi:MarR family transcriptional regulator, repressor for mepA
MEVYMPANQTEHPYHFYMRNILHKMNLSIDAHLKPYNISNQQARIVGIIGEKEDAGIRICQKDIENAMGITGASVTSLLQGLERKGFITRIRSGADDRVKELSLTQKGKDLMNTFHGVFAETEKKIVCGMSDDQKELFLRFLQSIDKNFDV